MKKFIMLMYAETLAIAGGLAELSKSLISRNRPYANNNDNSKESDESKLSKDHSSFFSGHETNSSAIVFLTAYLVNHYSSHRSYKLAVYFGAFVVSGVMGYLRYSSRKHYLSDILTGYVVGSGTGLLVPYLHKDQLP